MTKISIIIPVLNEAAGIQTFLQTLQPLRKLGHELILVDGGSTDNTCQLAHSLVDKLLHSEHGRAKQQIVGAENASGYIFLFLHADTQLPELAEYRILKALANGRYWGFFNIKLSGSNWLLRIIGKMMSWRSRLTGISTGDQGIFVKKSIYNKVEGIPDIPLMEDIAFSKRLLKVHKPVCLKERVITSSRRWEKNGIIKTVVFMWILRLSYFFRVKPEILHKIYYPGN